MYVADFAYSFRDFVQHDEDCKKIHFGGALDEAIQKFSDSSTFSGLCVHVHF